MDALNVVDQFAIQLVYATITITVGGLAWMYIRLRFGNVSNRVWAVSAGVPTLAAIIAYSAGTDLAWRLLALFGISMVGAIAAFMPRKRWRKIPHACGARNWPVASA